MQIFTLFTLFLWTIAFMVKHTLAVPPYPPEKMPIIQIQQGAEQSVLETKNTKKPS